MSNATTNGVQPAQTPVRVIFFGMTGAFSRTPLLALLRAGEAPRRGVGQPIEVCAVVLPTLAGASSPRLLRPDADDPHPAFIQLDRRASAPPPARRRPLATLPMAAIAPASGARPLADAEEHSRRNILEIASEQGIPTFEVARLADPRTLAALVAFAPDAICVACFSRRLPPALLRLPRLGCLNVHPSLLPANRGPDPLFWSLQRGDAATGATIHMMDERLDTGPIALQQAIPIPEGIDEAALEAQLAALGGALLVRAIGGLASGALHPTPQDDALASAHPWPTADDYTITADWSAQRAYRFARGIADRRQPISLVAADGVRFRLIAALDYSSDADNRAHPNEAHHIAPWRRRDDQLWLRCASGVLHAQVAPDE